MTPRILTDSDKKISKDIYFIPVKKDGTPLLDTSNVTNMKFIFTECSNLMIIPLLDTNNAINMSYMFNLCSNLVTVPILNTSSVTNMNYMFNDCLSLSNESLNNILMIYKNAVKITDNKTLKYIIGLTSDQATICQGLSNYSAFIAAGWTTGY